MQNERNAAARTWSFFRAPSKHVPKTDRAIGHRANMFRTSKEETCVPLKGNSVSAKGNAVSAKGNMFPAKGNTVSAKGSVCPGTFQD